MGHPVVLTSEEKLPSNRTALVDMRRCSHPTGQYWWKGGGAPIQQDIIGGNGSGAQILTESTPSSPGRIMTDAEPSKSNTGV